MPDCYIDMDCIFCKIVNGDIPTEFIYENSNVIAFMDIGPLSDGHCLVIPKGHAEKLHEVDDNTLMDILIVLKNIALALNIENYNILQNNGRIAHQAVNHVHFHLIPKPDENTGLKIKWDTIDNKNQGKIARDIIKKLN